MLGLDIFLGNFSFCVCQPKGKCMCRIHIDQKSGGCLYIIQEIKGWRNFILIWGQQNKVTEEQHACSSPIQIKANARLHLGATELTGLRSSNTSLVTEALCRTCMDASYKKGWHLHLTALLTKDPVAYMWSNVTYFLCHIHTRQESKAQSLCHRFEQASTSKPAAERCTETAQE